MIHWRYVKGLNQNNGSSDLYTFLAFDYKRNNTLTAFANTPSLYVNTTNAFSGATELGHIITQKATGQSIDTLFTFKNQVNFNRSSAGFYAYAKNGDVDAWALYTPADASYTNLDIHKAFCIHDKKGNNGNGCTVLRILNADSSSAISYTAFSFDRAYIRLGNATLLNQDGDLSAKRINSDGNITSGGKCEAVYFNATSDKRAKTNLKPLEINALDLINRVQLYSFKYKDSDLPSIGILAQDVQDVNIEGFDLVDNKQASGIDMDYMSIHESKLTYILWKAIQEQQKEIKELKNQIKNLTK